MIDLYYWPTPNGHKIAMFLEESGLPYRIVPINIGQGEQFQDNFLAISPNNRIPAIVDQAPIDGGPAISVFESGAILQYLAEKTGALLPAERRARVAALEWLFWQVANLGPIAGQNHHFGAYAAEKLPYAVERFVNETNRLYGVLDSRLEGRAYLAGDEYSIADIATYPWIVPWKRQQQTLDDFPNVRRWFESIRYRPATLRAYERGKELSQQQVVSAESRSILFGQTARSVREQRRK